MKQVFVNTMEDHKKQKAFLYGYPRLGPWMSAGLVKAHLGPQMQGLAITQQSTEATRDRNCSAPQLNKHTLSSAAAAAAAAAAPAAAAAAISLTVAPLTSAPDQIAYAVALSVFLLTDDRVHG